MYDNIYWLFRQILNDVTYDTKYRDNGFYVFVCSYDPANKEVATITQHGFVKAIIGKQLHELRYHMNIDHIKILRTIFSATKNENTELKKKANKTLFSLRGP